MKNLKYSVLLILFFWLSYQAPVLAQIDSRGRVTSTIIADGLAQLPAKNVSTYNQVMEELAQTGSVGMKSLIGMMNPSAQGGNASFEYAIDGVVNYVTRPDKVNLKNKVKDGLVQGLQDCKDEVQQAFLLTLLQKLATASDVSVFESYLQKDYLRPYVLQALAVIPGIDDYLVEKIPSSPLSKSSLAHLISMRQLTHSSLEPLLLSWIPGADDSTLTEIYHALAVCGTSKSLNPLKAAASKAGYQYEKTHATDSYLQLLTRLSLTDAKPVNKQARILMNRTNRSVRCAGLQLLLQTSGQKGESEIIKALKDEDIQYRNTALQMAEKVAGKDIYSRVAQKIDQFSLPAQTDVVRWLGNNRQQGLTDVIIKKMNDDNKELASAAIKAGTQVGGDQVLKAIIGLLGGRYGEESFKALGSFAGDINSTVVGALDTEGTSAQEKLLQLVAKRKMSQAYPQVIRLLASENTNVKNAAYDALGEISTFDHFDSLCDKMENADGQMREKLQKAALYALHLQNADVQYAAIDKRMNVSSAPQLYDAMLAQAGNQQAIDRLVKEYRQSSAQQEAFDALLKVENPLAIDVLYQIASTNADQREDALTRCLTLVKGTEMNNAVQYLLYRRALELHPSAKVENTFLDAVGQIPEWPALALAASYMENPANAFDAATAVKNIISKNKTLLGGQTVKNWLQKAMKVFGERKEDPDAGYAVDEIKGMLTKLAADGFDISVDKGTAKGKATVEIKKVLENFELYFDWKTNGKGRLDLRSMPEVILDGQNGPQFMFAAQDKLPEIHSMVQPGQWNTMYVQLVDDRLTIVSNGVVVAQNAIIRNSVAASPINAKGLVSFFGGDEGLEVRDLALHELPSTPVFTLSKEEKAAGFEVLFDGRSLNQWEGNLVNYVPNDGNIYVDAGYGNGGNLYSKKKYSDFVYRFEFSFVHPGVNNGIGIRTKHDVDAAYDGMEIQVLDHDDPIYKGLHSYQQHGAVYGVIVPKHVKFGPLGTWNTEEIRAVGDHITVTVNGQVILDGNIREACQGHNVSPDGSDNNPYTVDHKNHPGLFNKEGNISFCGHGEGIRFRNVRILDLSKKR